MLISPAKRPTFPGLYYVITELALPVSDSDGRDAEESKEAPERPAVRLRRRGVDRPGGPHMARRTEEIGTALATAVAERISMRSKGGAYL
jgi:hypothetical protein